MTTTSRFHSTSQALWGGLLLIFGSALLLDNLEVVELGSLWRYWPFLIVAVGIGKFFQAERPSERRGAAWWVFLGLWLYVSIFEIYNLGFGESWPLLIVAWGVGIVWKAVDDYRAAAKKEHIHE